MPELSSGQSLAARFTLIRRLGAGGMGQTWLARDRNLGTEVVVKAVPAGSPAEQIDLLRQEYRHARRLSHPHIVRVFDFHQDEHGCFITMEHVDGGDIGVLRGGDLAEILRVVVPLARALEHAHGQGVIHRDLKCSNVLLDSSGRPRLSDFGIAGALRPAEADLRPSGGGSRHSVSPQQLAGEPPSPADDIYGLGALLYELIVGSPPLGAAPTDEQIRSTEPPEIDAHRPLPAGLRSLVSELLAKTPAERPPDMETVAERLSVILQEVDRGSSRPSRSAQRPVRLTPPPKIPAIRAATLADAAAGEATRSPDPRPRHLGWLTAVAFAVLGSAAVAVFVLLPSWVSERQRGSTAAVTDRDSAAAAATVDERAADPELEADTPVPGRVAAGGQDGDPPAPAGERPIVKPNRPARVAPPEPLPASGDFARAMSRGLAALERGENGEARQAFETALALRPESAAAAEGLAGAEQALRLGAIGDHRERAVAFELEERWREAAREYESVLSLDATIRFAQQGRRRSIERAELSDRLDAYSSRPERISSDEVLEAASRLVATAETIEPRGERLRRQIELLRQQIEIAATPIPVILLSDGNTEVVVYRVGRLGAFKRRVLHLRPGSYTVVGSREGFRDIRRQLEVKPGRDPEPLEVRCEEPIG